MPTRALGFVVSSPVMRMRSTSLLLLGLAVACGDDRGTSDSASAGSGTTTAAGTTTGTTAGTTPTTGATVTGSGSEGSSTTLSTTTSGLSATATGEPTTSTTSTASSSVPATTESTGEEPCDAGEIVCQDGVAKVCDGAGGFRGEAPCPLACVDGVGCASCVPGESRCEDDTVYQCDETGEGELAVETCDPVQGLACDAGACVGTCADLTGTLGCDFYPTVTATEDMAVFPDVEFGVAIVNPANGPVTLTVTRGDALVHEATIGAGEVEILALPWIFELYKDITASVLVSDGAYRLRTDGPVAVYQRNPLGANNITESSLLLPAPLWTGNYVIASWKDWGPGFPGFYTVTAAHDDTTVVLTPSATGHPVMAGAGVAADGTGEITLDAGDVLQVLTRYAAGADLTGTRISADKPVQVISGHKCTQLPHGTQACQHLEEAMIPIERLATRYVVGPPAQVPMNALDKPQFVRVIATEDDTKLSFEPDQPVGTTLAAAGDFVELSSTTARFVVTADKKIVVAQYMVGNGYGYGNGDPSMLLAAAPSQWRKDYLVHATTAWAASNLDLIAQAGAQVLVDGQLVGDWQDVGDTGFVHAHVPLSNAGSGAHTITSDLGVGVAVSGVKAAGSSWHRADLDLPLAP